VMVEEMDLLVTSKQIDAWNDRRLAERPFYQTPEQSVSRWQASCEAIYRQTCRMTDADLERIFWLPLFRGCVTTRDALEFCRDHDWSVLTQLRIHMGRTEPVPSPAVTHGYLGTWMNSFSTSLNQALANGHRFTTIMAFTDPGVGAWTIRVADGVVTVSEGETVSPDLVITQSAETFEKTVHGMQTPAEAILSGELHCSDFKNMIIFGQLFGM
jgi:hypothetical protein